MVRVYYHICILPGIESLIDEQLDLIEKHFTFPHTLDIGISVLDGNLPLQKLSKYCVREVKRNENEFLTLDLILNDSKNFNDDDYIFYFHTKGITRLDSENITSWRNLMSYFNIEKCEDVLRILGYGDYNTYGVLLETTPRRWYSGNFWWASGKYLKTIDITGVDKTYRLNAEANFISKGIKWRPYSPYNVPWYEGHYTLNFKREEYARK